MREGLEHQATDIDDWSYLEGCVETVRQECVVDHEIGGWTIAGRLAPFRCCLDALYRYNSRRSLGQRSESIGIFVFGPKSLGEKSQFERLLEVKFACVIDSDGNIRCDPDNGASSSGSQFTSGSQSNSVNAPTGGGSGKQQCGGPCADIDDCDYNNSCLCASNAPVPMSSTFGRYSCKYIPNYIGASSAALALGSSCRGKCLLSANGSIEVPASTDSKDSTFPANATMAQFLAAASISPIFCVCNCTFVSPACCLAQNNSGMVYEVRTPSIAATPANGTVCCDHDTGQWGTAPVARDSPSGDAACPRQGGSVTDAGYPSLGEINVDFYVLRPTSPP